MQKLDLLLEDCDLKFAKSEGTFEGYLSVFGNVDSYGDTIIKGAYVDTLKDRKRMPPMLLNHDAFSVPIGVWKSMSEDDRGLRVQGELTKGNTISEQVHASMKHGAMTGLSIGYRAIKAEENDHGGHDLHKIDLREGSVVTMPAEDAARIDVVKFEEEFGQIESIRDFEYSLREAGCSRALAKHLVGQFKDISQREADDFQRQIQVLTDELQVYQKAQDRADRLTRLKAMV